MIQITPHMRILICCQNVDFRKGMDGLAQVCRSSLKVDPMSGAMFVFRNRRKTCVKVLVYDGQGFWLCHKRLSSGRFKWWPTMDDEGAFLLSSQALQILLSAGNPMETTILPDWKPLLE